MPYRSEKQRRYVYARANAGERWAQSFVAHSHGKKIKRRRKRVKRG